MNESKQQPRPTIEDNKRREEFAATLGEGSDDYQAILDAFDWSTEVFESNGLYGIKTAWDEVLLEAGYEDLRLLPYEELKKGDKVAAQLNGHWGILILDGKGSWLIEPEYDDIGYPNTLTHVRKGNEWGVINIDKKDFVLPLGISQVQTESGFMFVNGIGIYEKNGKFGVIAEEGIYTEAIFDKVDDEPFGHVKVRLNKIWGYIDKNGQFTENKESADHLYRYKG